MVGRRVLNGGTMPVAKGSNRQQWHAGFVLPSTLAGIKGYIARTGRKCGNLTDAMWAAFCSQEGLDPATGQPVQADGNPVG